MPFYTFHQNNSGGTFDYDPARGITAYVIIEAPSRAAALARAEAIGLYFDGVAKGLDCECCGDRWYAPAEGTPTPTIFDKPPAAVAAREREEHGWLLGPCADHPVAIHWADRPFELL